MIKFIVTSEEAGRRADILVAQHLPDYTRSSLSQLFDKQMVEADGKTIKASYKPKSNELLSVDTSFIEKQPPKISLPIIYEDMDVIVVNKPAGILTHAKGALNQESTVASFIRPKLKDKTMTDNRAGIVHRLDRGTSGVIITAKSQNAHKWLQKQFSTRQVRKIYLAIIEGVPKEAEAVIDAPIGRNPRKPQTFKVTSQGKPAVTQYKVLKGVNTDRKFYSLVELEPKTGRTHQLRVHLAYIDHPIVDDNVYGKSAGPIYLHAKSLEIHLPNGELKKFIAPVPSKFKRFFE